MSGGGCFKGIKRWWNNGYNGLDRSQAEIEEDEKTKSVMLRAIQAAELRVSEIEAHIRREDIGIERLWKEQADHILRSRDHTESPVIRLKIMEKKRMVDKLTTSLNMQLKEKTKAEEAYGLAINTVVSNQTRKTTLWFTTKLKLPQTREVQNDTVALSTVGASLAASAQLSADASGAGGESYSISDAVSPLSAEREIEEEYKRELESRIASLAPVIPSTRYTHSGQFDALYDDNNNSAAAAAGGGGRKVEEKEIVHT